MAGHLALMGFPVSFFDIVPETVETIREGGGIELSGVVRGFGKIDLITDRIDEATDGADIVVVVTPATAHREVARNCAPHLKDEQIVFIHPGATGGALEFKKILADERCKARVVVAEANSLIYACRSPQPGRASILGVKKELMVAALPAKETPRVIETLRTAFHQIHAGRNVLETSLGNPNAMMHPAPTVLNTSMVESGKDWLYYWDGITATIGDFVETMDQERLSVARAVGLNLPSIREWYRLAYGATGKNLSEVVRNNPAYEEVKGQKTLLTRYLLEDIPMGLVPMVSLGKMIGIDVSRMETVIKMAQWLTKRDFFATGRTAEALGLSGMSAEGVVAYVETGTP
jgi:opine dehydrogenase